MPVIPKRHNKRLLVLLALLVLVAVGGFFWYRNGFSLQFSKFFAANNPSACGGPNVTLPQDFNWSVLKPEKTALGGVPYHVRSATFHSDTAGCSPTATEGQGGLGGSLSGPVTCNSGNDDCYTYHWNPALGEQCGRYQLDSGAYKDSDNSWIPGAGIGVVLNWGVDCTPTTTAPVCAPKTGSAFVNDPLTFNVTGGTAPFTWLSTGTELAETQSTAHQSYLVSFPTAGDKVIKVTDATPKSDTCSVTITDRPPVGFLDAVTCTPVNGVSGWARDPDSPEKPVTVRFFDGLAKDDGSNYLDAVLANQHRIDVGDHGFTWAIPDSLRDGKSHRIYAYAYSNETLTLYLQLPHTDVDPQPPAAVICPPPITSTPVCAPKTQAALTGQAVSLSVAGGVAPYRWASAGGTPIDQGGSSFSVSYAAVGDKVVTVTDANEKSDTCAVTVTAPVVTTNPVCAPKTQSVTAGQAAAFTVTGGTAPYSWSSTGSTTVQTGTSYTVAYAAAGTQTVTVKDAANKTDTCAVTITAATTQLTCSPAQQSATVGQNVTFTAAGGLTSSPFYWTAPNGNPSSFTNSLTSNTFTTTYAAPGSYVVTVTKEGMTATCAVTVSALATTPALTIQKTVRNVTQNGSEADNVNANPSETVEFILRVAATGTAPSTQVIARDTLPSGLAYQGGTTTIDGSPASDGIVGTGLNLGDMASGRTITVRFRATVAPETFFTPGTTVLSDIAFARGSNVAEVSDLAFVTVTRIPPNASMTLVKLGRNITRGETVQSSVVHVSPSQTVEFALHVRNTSATVLTGLVVRDVVPQGITFVPGTVKVNGATVSGGDALVTGGIGLAPLAAGQEVVITFVGTVSPASQFPVGLTTLLNTAYATAGNVPQLIAQLPVIVEVIAVVVPPIKTGPGESALLALVISAIITLLYIGYTSTETFRRREAKGLVRDSKQDRSSFDFRR